MKYLFTKIKHYKNFINENNTDRLEKNLKIQSNEKTGKLIKEVFNEPLETDYKIEKDDRVMLISFFTKSGYKYRLDILRTKEYDKSNEKINHIDFSDYDESLENISYEDSLQRNEMIEVLNRIHFILKDLFNKGHLSNQFCIGGTTLLSKNKIYKYALKIIVGENGFKKMKTDIYETGYGLYFSI